jgi:pentatricopeptide repeat protein
VAKNSESVLSAVLPEIASAFPSPKEWTSPSQNPLISRTVLPPSHTPIPTYLDVPKVHPLTPNIHTYTALMSCYVARGQLDQAWKVMQQVLERAKQADRAVDQQLRLLSIRLSKSQETKAVRKFIRKQMAELRHQADWYQPDRVMYTTLITACLRHNDLDRAWKIFDAMMIPDGPTTTTGTRGITEKAINLASPDSVTYTLMIDVCSRRGQVEKALTFVEDMRGLGLPLTDVTYNTLIRCCAKRHDYARHAFVLLEQMKADGYQPDVHTFYGLLTACGTLGDVPVSTPFMTTKLTN